MSKLYVTNWSSYRIPDNVGAGRKLTIMARPREWERGEGSVPLFIPDPDDLRAIQGGVITRDEYRSRFLRLVAYRVRVKGLGLKPGKLMTATTAVRDGDTLMCACGAEKARSGGCHRVWTAAFLQLAGWEVVLDGAELDETVSRALIAKASPDPTGSP